ncbi:Uncharacterised protein [uncultured archaeon]|nr:Uncharacterised protein [uncultured archaeon]
MRNRSRHMSRNRAFLTRTWGCAPSRLWRKPALRCLRKCPVRRPCCRCSRKAAAPCRRATQPPCFPQPRPRSCASISSCRSRRRAHKGSRRCCPRRARPGCRAGLTLSTRRSRSSMPPCPCSGQSHTPCRRSSRYRLCYCKSLAWISRTARRLSSAFPCRPRRWQPPGRCPRRKSPFRSRGAAR